MSFLSKLVGIGLVAGAAVAAVKLIEKVWALDDVVYTVETGEFPLEDGTDAEDAPEAPYRPFDPDAALAPVPNVNPVEAPPAVPVTDPTKIADPADFQDWDALGCQGCTFRVPPYLYVTRRCPGCSGVLHGGNSNDKNHNFFRIPGRGQDHAHQKTHPHGLQGRKAGAH